MPGNKQFAIGDTISADKGYTCAPIPRFSPEHFARLVNIDIGKSKQFNKGLQQLATEGAMQVLYETDAQKRDPILGVVGVLQFEVVQARLEGEYNGKTKLEPLPHQLARYVSGPEADIEQLPWRYSMMRVKDDAGNLVALLSSPHELNFYANKFPAIEFKTAV